MEPMQSTQTKQFENLVIPRKTLTRVVSRYRVYESARDFKLVEASTAMEALTMSGLKSAYKILREDPLKRNLLESDVWMGGQEENGKTAKAPSDAPINEPGADDTNNN